MQNSAKVSHISLVPPPPPAYPTLIFCSFEALESKFRLLIPGGRDHVLCMYCKMTITLPDDAISYSEGY